MAPQGLTVARCVTPQALDGGRCCCFASMEPQVYARGFSTLYRQVLKSDYTDMRRELTAYLSGYRYYYDYMRGRRLLSPAQQQWIRDMMLRYGYTDEVTFDGYEAAFDFPWVCEYGVFRMRLRCFPHEITSYSGRDYTVFRLGLRCHSARIAPSFVRPEC